MRQVYSIAIILIAGSPLFAQLGPSGPSSSGTAAAQLPLSGRGAQNGSVNSTQTPLPGITSSVNTLNSTVQVQGPYVGSIPHEPITGKLSLQDAIQRGLQYNLGAPDSISLFARLADKRALPAALSCPTSTAICGKVRSRTTSR